MHLHCSFECTATTEIPRYRIRELYSLFLSRTIFLVTPERERFAYLSPKLRAHDNFRRAWRIPESDVGSESGWVANQWGEDRCILTTDPGGTARRFSFRLLFFRLKFILLFRANRYGWQCLIAAAVLAFSRYAIARVPVFNALEGTARWLWCYYSPMKREMQPFTVPPPRRFNSVIAFYYHEP